MFFSRVLRVGATQGSFKMSCCSWFGRRWCQFSDPEGLLDGLLAGWLATGTTGLWLHAHWRVKCRIPGPNSKQYSCHKLQDSILQDCKITRTTGTTRLQDCKTTGTTILQTKKKHASQPVAPRGRRIFNVLCPYSTKAFWVLDAHALPSLFLWWKTRDHSCAVLVILAPLLSHTHALPSLLVNYPIYSRVCLYIYI